MILDIRGTHGSGKSYVAHQLLQYGAEEIVGYNEYKKKETILGYHVPALRLAIVGKYATQCGGCDGVGNSDEVVRRVRLFSANYRHVLLEGILVAHTFDRYHRLAYELTNAVPGHDYRFCFLDTPLETCIKRVQSRRDAKGVTKELNPKNITKDHHNIWTVVRGKMVAAGHNVHILNHLDPMPQVLEILHATS